MDPAVENQLTRLRKLRRIFQRGSRQVHEQFPLVGLSSADIKQLTLRDREIWERMIPLLYPIAINKASQLLKDKKRADSLARDAITKVFFSKGKINDESHLRGLITLTVRNLFIDENEKENFHRSEEVEAKIKEEYDEQFETKYQDPRSCAQRNEQKRALEQIIALLPKEDYRRFIELHYFKGMTIDEIVELDRKPRGSVSVDLHRAIKVLRELTKHHSQMSDIAKYRHDK